LSRLKILIVGLGSIGQRHARNLRTLLGEEVELLAVRTRRNSPVIGLDMRAEAGDPEVVYGIRSFDDLDDALAERPTVVLVANPSAMHMPVALAAARAGCHLFVEKPLSHSEEGVDELIRIVEGRGLVCLVGHQLRFHPGFRLLAALIHRHAVGTVLAAHFEFGEHLSDWHPWEDYRAGAAARADHGGGVVLTQIHDLDLAYALFGLPQRVFAVGGKRSRLEVDVEDTADMLLDCGGVAVHVHQDLLQRPPTRGYQVIGDEGKIVWDYYGGFLDVEKYDGSVERTSFAEVERNRLFLDELAHFLACVEGREEPLVGVQAGADTLRIALAAKRSLETGEPVVVAA
jgi:predicted dehydrogenase